jgi:hypothetical protein
LTEGRVASRIYEKDIDAEASETIFHREQAVGASLRGITDIKPRSRDEKNG